MDEKRQSSQILEEKCPWLEAQLQEAQLWKAVGEKALVSNLGPMVTAPGQY
jgi:hypothetical protein